MTRYIVTKSFQDRYTREYYGVGESYETNDENRGFELENGGYIAQENTEMASMAMQQKANQASQENRQASSQGNQAAQKAAEPMTVLNGQVMSVKDAQRALEKAEMSATKTGIQSIHDNSTEPVQAGQESQENKQDPQPTQVNVRQANVQSAQGHMDQHVQSAQSEAQGQAHQAGYEGSSQEGGLANKLAEASSNPSSQSAEQNQQSSANSTSSNSAKARATKKGE
jgi:hypothetical protein